LNAAPSILTPEQLSENLANALLRIGQLEEHLRHQQRRYTLLEEKLRLVLIKKYGSGAERLSANQLNLLELEPGVCAQEVAGEASAAPCDTSLPSVEQTQKTPRAKPVRAALPQHLERKERIIRVPAAECTCSQCGELKKLIGYESSERLAIQPVELYVELTKREKRACPRCEELGVSTAPVPATIIEKGVLADSLVVETTLNKYLDHLPLYRQAARLGRDVGIEVSQSTLGSSVLKVGELLLGVAEAMKKELLAGGYVQADETTVPVQSERTRGKNHQAYLWEYSLPGSVVVYDFQMGRARGGPANFLEGFGGRLQSDGYAAYGKIGAPGLLHFGCWAHARRKFFEASKLDAKDAKSVAVVRAIGSLYEVEHRAREGNLPPEEREALRAKECPALLKRIKELITQTAAEVLPKSALGKACTYALKQWERLERYASAGHGVVEIDNNWAENAMRGVALGRKNWLQIGSESAGPKVAAILSVLESCKRLGISAREYLLEVLPQLSYEAVRPQVKVKRAVGELTPTNWKRLRAGT
jgi:transposase